MFEKQILFILLLPIWIVTRVIFIALKQKNKSSFSIKREVVLNLFFLYILCVISVTLFPLLINFNRKFYRVSVNLVPVVGTVKNILNVNKETSMKNFMIKFWFKNIIGNLVMLVPLSLALPLLWERFRSLRKTILFVFFVSFSIETLQLLSSFIGNVGRAFDVDDIILNTLGAFIGYGVYNKFFKGKKLI